jgi:hypothetical protein
MELAISIVIVEELLCSKPLLFIVSSSSLDLFRGLQFSILKKILGILILISKNMCRDTGEPLKSSIFMCTMELETTISFLI